MSNMAISGYQYGSYSGDYSITPVSGNGSTQAAFASQAPEASKAGMNKTVFNEKDQKERLGIKDPSEECQTCKNRKYQDGSNEGNVSFKSAAHVAPEAAASAVRAHEGQHVSNAYKKAEQNNGEVVRARVSIHTSICPECGRSYVSGGTTSTQIKYFNEENPYQKDLKTTDGLKYKGMNVNLIA